MKFKSFILCLFAAYSAFAFDFSKTEFLQIPEGNVYQIKNSNGEILWSVVPNVSTNMIRTEYGIKSTQFDAEGEALMNKYNVEPLDD